MYVLVRWSAQHPQAGFPLVPSPSQVRLLQQVHRPFAWREPILLAHPTCNIATTHTFTNVC